MTPFVSALIIVLMTWVLLRVLELQEKHKPVRVEAVSPSSHNKRAG